MKHQIKELAKSFHQEINSCRQWLHQHPELSFKEYNTADYIAAQLDKIGVKYERNWVKTGIVAYVQGNKSKSDKTISLRADIDALPIKEENQTSYTSQNEGIMHACGHDVHSSCMLGAIKILHELKNEWSGTIKCIFQPGEEKHPGGASLMIKEGVLENPKPESIFGQHVFPDLVAGKVGFREGIYMAAADELHITIQGKGGHGAMPHKCVDPILISSHIVVAIQQLVSRWNDPTTPAVLTIGKIESNGGATNIIPSEVFLKGTFRSMNEPFREQAHQKIKKLIHSICEAMGGSAIIDLKKGYPVLENNVNLTTQAKQWAKDYLGKEQVIQLPIRMTAEDFAYYSQEIPACFYRLGTASPDGTNTSAVHTPTFDVDAQSIEVGMGLMAYLAWSELQEKNNSK